MQTIATVSTCATLLIGFTLKVDRGMSGEQAGEYDDKIIDIILILLFIGVGFSGMFIILKSLPCFASEEEEEEESPEEEEKKKSPEVKETPEQKQSSQMSHVSVQVVPEDKQTPKE